MDRTTLIINNKLSYLISYFIVNNAKKITPIYHHIINIPLKLHKNVPLIFRVGRYIIEVRKIKL